MPGPCAARRRLRRVAAAHRSSTQAGCRGSRPLTDTEEPVAESTCSASLASKIHCIIYHVTPPPIRRPYPATSHRLRMLRHPVAAVHVQRKRRCSSPFPLWTSAKHWRRASGDCTSPHSQPSNEPSPPRGNTFFIPPMESAAFVKRHLGDPDSICFQADEAATKTNTTRTTTSTIPERRSTPSTSTWIPGC